MRALRFVAGLLWCAFIGATIYVYAVAVPTGGVLMRLEGLISAVTGISFVIGFVVTQREDRRYIGWLATIGSALLLAAMIRTLWPVMHGLLPHHHTMATLATFTEALTVASFVWFYFAGTLWFGGAIRRQFLMAFGRLRRRHPPG